MSDTNTPENPTETEEEPGGCGWEYDHTWQPGDYECRECGADLSSWNEG